MADTDHIYNPSNDSLAERIRAYREVYQAWMNVEASMKAVGDSEFDDYLGEREDVEYAYNATVKSLKMAIDNLDQSELQQAQEQGLLSKDEMVEIIQEKRMQEMQSQYSSQEHSHSRGHSR